MDSSGPRGGGGGGGIKTEILRVCVAIVLSATGLIFARFVYRKEDDVVTSFASNPESSSSPSRRNDGEDEEEETESLDHQKRENLILKSRSDELQRKVYEMEMRLERYCNLKDQEVMLMEHKGRLALEKSQLDFSRRELLAMEEEHKRGQDLVIVYLKLVEEIQGLRSENGLLEGHAKKLRRRTMQLYQVVNEKSRKLIDVETEFLKCVNKSETKNNVMKELEDEVRDLKTNVDVLQREKEEISMRLSNSTSEVVSVQAEYKRVLEEYEELKKDYASGKKEVNYLRWITTCLRDELKRNETSYGDLQDFGLEDDQSWKMTKLMKKLKKCVKRE